MSFLPGFHISLKGWCAYEKPCAGVIAFLLPREKEIQTLVNNSKTQNTLENSEIICMVLCGMFDAW